ncbi:caffeoylshikimate esterase-like [Arachis ipaensis]|uniref:caffeoylshikimate esterase-like n=1 Tax=Arachis ipaensis TaxID=130454 RepID=UPI0007AF8E94|nr:caffeoylshikimate esterase-like [Arachis ipaensis]
MDLATTPFSLSNLKSHHYPVHPPPPLKLFTQCWRPLPPATVTRTLALVHGFIGESSWFLQLTTIYFAKAGFATCTIDHQGHGFSNGLIAHIPDINPIVDDCIAFFDEFCSRFDPSLPSFLYSESLGGAIVLLITLHCRDFPENVSFVNRA